MPTDVLAYLDLKSISLEPRKFISFLGKKWEADIVFKAKFEDRDGFLLLLLEHQSSFDKFMPFRILWYTLQLFQRHIDFNKGVNVVPLVIPMVLSHQQHAWPYSTDLKDYIAGPDNLIEKYTLSV